MLFISYFIIYLKLYGCDILYPQTLEPGEEELEKNETKQGK